MIENRSIMQITWNYLANAQKCQQVLHFTNTTEYPDADPILVCDRALVVMGDPLQSDVLEKMLALMSNAVNITSVDAQIVYPFRYIKRTRDVVIAGGDNSSCAAQNVAAVVSKRTTNAGRSQVGTFHLGGLGSGVYQNGLFQGASFGLVEALKEALELSFTTTAPVTVWEPCILNKTPIVGSDPVKYKISGSSLILECVAKREVRTMRRRTVGQGV